MEVNPYAGKLAEPAMLINVPKLVTVYFAGAVSAEKHLPSTFLGMDRIGGLCQNTYGIGPGLEKSWRQKKGDGVGKTKRGKRTKIMGLADAGGLPLFAWLQNFRRLVVRYEYHLENFLAMIQLGCIVILLRRVLG